MAPKINKIGLLFCLFLLAWFSLLGQGLPTDEIRVEKDYEVNLLPSSKLDLEPSVEESSDELKFDYLLVNKIFPLEYPAPEIKPMSMKIPKPPPVYDGYAKVGVGYPLGAFADVGYSFAPTDELSAFVQGFHHSSTEQDLNNQKFSNTSIGGQMTFLTDLPIAIDAKAKVSLDRYHFFGFDQSDTSLQFEDDQLVHKLNDISLGARVYNYTETAADLDYWLDIDGYVFGNNFATNENALFLDMGLRKYLGENPLSLALGSKFVNLKDTIEHNISQFFIQPGYLFSGQNFKVDLGVNAIAGDEEFFIYPDVELSYLLANGFSISAGVTGDLDVNSYKFFSRDNPYLVEHLSGLRHSEYLEIYGAFSANFYALQLSARAGYRQIDNLPFYAANSEQEFYQFDIGYDTTNLVFLDVNAKANILKGLQLVGTLVANFYSPEDQEKAWYLPRMNINAGAIYTALEGRLELKGDVFFQQAVEFIELDFGEQPNSLIDLSIGAEYLISENFGLFAQLNNVANNKATRWYAYQNYGLNVLGGISARF